MRFRRVPAALLLSGCLLPLMAQQPAGTIAGRVIHAVSGDAVRRVNLTLTRTGSKETPAAAQSDDSGRFSFANVAPGSYRLSAERNGFLRQEYGARLNPNSGARVAVSAGQSLDLTFRLVPAAAISGRILDQEGEPMPGLLISAMRDAWSGGRRQWTQASAAQANDRGEFRISGLMAGRYTIRATDMHVGIGIAGVSTGALPERPEPAYASTYLGNTVEQTRAAAIDLGPGEDRRGADIQMVKVASVRIRGKVAEAPEGKLLVVMLLGKKSAGGAAPGNIGLVQQNDGTFEFRGVTPGSYLMVARGVTEGMAAVGTGMPIEVGEHHIEGVEFRMGAGVEISGKVILPGGAAPDGSPGLTLENLDFDLPEAPQASCAADGSFVVKNAMPGRYRLRMRGVPENAYLGSVKLGDAPADETALEIGSAARLEIAMSPGGEIRGSVAGEDDKPLGGATVTLIPESGREPHYATAVTDGDGTFRLPGIRPGRYKLLAWEDIEGGAWLNAEFVKPFGALGAPVAVEENGRLKLSLKAIPYAQIAARAAR